MPLFSISVARIAYLASDVVISVQPVLAKDSEFSGHLRALQDEKAPVVLSREDGFTPEVC